MAVPAGDRSIDQAPQTEADVRTDSRIVVCAALPAETDFLYTFVTSIATEGYGKGKRRRLR